MLSWGAIMRWHCTSAILLPQPYANHEKKLRKPNWEAFYKKSWSQTVKVIKKIKLKFFKKEVWLPNFKTYYKSK